MNWWKRMMQRFARRAIAEELAEICMRHALEQGLSKMKENNAYLKGYNDGAQYALDSMEKCARERGQDLVTLEDVAKARKGIVH